MENTKDNTDLVLQSSNTNLLNLDYQSVKGLAGEFYRSGLFADATDESRAVVKIMAGQELNLPPLYAMRNFYLIPLQKKNRDGTYRTETQMAMSAQCMGLLLKRSKMYNWTVVTTDATQCVIQFEEKLDDGTWRKAVLSKYTIADAKRAGLIKDFSNWIKNPNSMLFARALSQGAKQTAPHLLGEAPYVPADFPEVDTVVDLSATKLLETAEAPEPEKKGKAKTLASVAAESTGVVEEALGKSITTEKEATDAIRKVKGKANKVQTTPDKLDEVAAVDGEIVEDESAADGQGGELFTEGEEDEQVSEPVSAGAINEDDATSNVDAATTSPEPPTDPTTVKSSIQLCQLAFKDMGFQPKDVLRILDVKSNLDIVKRYSTPNAYTKLWDYYCENKGSA